MFKIAVFIIHIYNAFINLTFVTKYDYKCFCFDLYFIRQLQIITAINNALVINKKVSKIYKFFVLQIIFFSLKIVVTVFFLLQFHHTLSLNHR